MVQNCSIEEVCNKTFAYSYSGIRSIERTLLEVSCQNVMPT